jgi:hypothetical protein
MTRVCWVGVAMICTGLILGGWRIAWDNSRSWALVDDVPISLSQGSRYESGDLPVNIAALYEIRVIVDNKIDSVELQCLLGAARDQKCDTTSMLRAHWILTSAGKTVMEGSSDDTVGNGGTMPWGTSRVVGQFDGQEGQRYKLDLDILSDTANLNITNPRLYVGVADYHLESALFISGFIKAFCGGIIAIGCLMLVGSFLLQRQANRPSGGPRLGNV